MHRLKQDFPALTIVINGGIAGDAAIAEQLQQVDGVMIGREAYHHPWSMAQLGRRLLRRRRARAGRTAPRSKQRCCATWKRCTRRASPGRFASRHMLGLWNGTPGARKWRQVWSNHRLKNEPPAQVARLADAARRREAPQGELLDA